MRRHRAPAAIPLALLLVSAGAGRAEAAGRAAALVAAAEADGMLASGDCAGALERYDAALASDDALAAAHHGRGLALRCAGRDVEAAAALERAAQLDPDAPRVHLDLALLYVASGDLFWAADELALAEEATPDDPRVAFERGRVLLELGETDVARELLATAAADPELGPRARTYLGIALAVKDDAAAAREQLERVVADAPGTAHAAFAASLIDELVQREWDLLPLVAGSLSVGGQYDSNVILDPDDAEARSGAAAGGLVLRGAMTLAPISTPAHLLFGSLSASRTFNFADPAGQFDLTTAAGATGYRFRFAAGGLAQAFQLAYRYDIGFLDGGSLTDDSGFYTYREAHGGMLRWALDEGDDWSTFVEAGYRYAAFADMRRDAHVLAGRLGQAFSFYSRRLKLLFALGGRFDDARSRGYDLWDVDLLFGISGLGPWSLEFLGVLRYEHQDHFDSAYYSGWGAGRVDDSIAATLAVGRPIWDFLAAEISWTHTEHLSTAGAFDYRRDVAGLTIKAVFR